MIFIDKLYRNKFNRNKISHHPSCPTNPASQKTATGFASQKTATGLGLEVLAPMIYAYKDSFFCLAFIFTPIKLIFGYSGFNPYKLIDSFWMIFSSLLICLIFLTLNANCGNLRLVNHFVIWGRRKFFIYDFRMIFILSLLLLFDKNREISGKDLCSGKASILYCHK